MTVNMRYTNRRILQPVVLKLLGRIAAIVACCYRQSSVVCLSVLLCVCVLGTLVSPAKTAEPIEKGKERKRIYIAPFIYCVYLKALRRGSYSFTCKYTMPAFLSYAFTR